MFKLINTCEHLQLIPLEEEQNSINAYLWECKQGDTTQEEITDYINHLFNRSYEPYCKKRDCPCVVCESPVISQQYHGIGNLHQPFTITFVNDSKITECSDRKIPETGLDMESLDIFLLTHIKGS